MTALRHPLVVPTLFAALAGALIGLRIVERGEIWLDRTHWLLATAAFGGFSGALATRLLLGARRAQTTLRFRRLLAGGLFAMLFMLGMMTAYVAQNLIIGGQFELDPERPIRSVIFTSIQIAALFLISSPTYLLPWPLPLLTMAAGWILAPAEPTKPVEPTGDGV